MSRLTDYNVNVRNAGVKTGYGKPAIISLQLDIRDHEQLECLVAKIKNMSDIIDLRRVTSVDVS